MLLPILYLLTLQVLISETKFYKTNITDFRKCQVYYSRHGSLYKDFFEIPEPKSFDNQTLLDFHFSVMASSDAHILLAPSSKVNKDDDVYEIVIGAGGNTFCDIRRQQKSLVKATIAIRGLLDALDPRSFWIHITQGKYIAKGGVVEIGKEGEDLAFLSWIDPDPIPIKVFSFSTWTGIEAKWYFNCEWNENKTEIKEVEKVLPPLDQLRRHLLSNYNPYVRPVLNHSYITPVGISLATSLVTLVEHKSILRFSGVVVLDWHDEKLKWQPSDYNGIGQIHVFRHEIWKPNLFLFNTANADYDILDDSMIIVNSTGSVVWKTSINLESWCSPNDLGRWPKDEHECELKLSFMREITDLQLIFRSNDSYFDPPYLSNWQITRVETAWNKGWNSSNYKIIDPPMMIINFKLKRVSNVYSLLFITPFVVIAVSQLITFCISPFGGFKVGLICFQMILSSIILIALGIIIPIHSQIVPNSILLYSCSLIGSIIFMIIEIIVINISRNPPRRRFPQWLARILLSFPMGICLALHDTQHVNENGESTKTKSKNHEEKLWILFGVTIDRICFIICLLLSIYAFYITY